MKNEIKKYFIAIIIFALPIMLANFYYIDDIGRSIEGYTNWGIDGRPLADLLMKTLMMSHRLVDIYPLNILISSFILATSFAFLRKDLDTYLPKRKTSFFLPLLLVFNVFFLEVISYRFDSITITSSIALCIFGGRLYKKEILDIFFTTVITVAVMSLYQITVNLLIILTIFNLILFCSATIETQVILRKMLLKFFSLFIGVMLYFFIVLPNTHTGIESADHPGINITSSINNIYNYIYSMVYIISGMLLKKDGDFMILSLYIIAQISCISLAIKKLTHSKIISALLLITPAIVFLSMFGVLLTLGNLLYSPRIYLSYGGFIFFCFATAYIALPQRLNWCTYLCVIPLMHSLILSYAYGNILKSQEVVNQQTARNLNDDIKTYIMNTETIKLAFNGKYPSSPITENTIAAFPQLNSLIPNYFANWWWSFQYMRRLGYQYTYPGTIEPRDIVRSYNMCSDAHFIKRSEYQLLIKDEMVIIDFDGTICNK